jgi:branched-chain amino acid transport system permease protein
MARIIVMVVIGGLGSFIAPVIGAPPVYALNTWLAAWGEWSMVVFAAIVILIMRAYPAGLAGLISAMWRRRPGGPSTASSSEGQAREFALTATEGAPGQQTATAVSATKLQ